MTGMHFRGRIIQSGNDANVPDMLGWYFTQSRPIRRENTAGTYTREHGPHIVFAGDYCIFPQ